MKPIFKCSSGAAKVNRVTNLIAIIEAMSKGSMSLIEISEAIGYSKSGGRKYIKELAQSNVVDFSGYVATGTGRIADKAMYALNASPEFVAAYVETIKLIGVPKQKDILQAAPSADRNLHLVQDDTIFRVKMASFKAPEHTELLARFYGMAQS